MSVPFALGNQLAVNRRTVENHLRRAAHRSPAALDRACMRLIESAADGDTWQERIAAFGLLADRLDGKAKQSLEVSNTDSRDLDLASIVQAVLAARATTATDAAMIERSDTQTLEPLSVQADDQTVTSSVTSSDTLPRIP